MVVYRSGEYLFGISRLRYLTPLRFSRSFSIQLHFSEIETCLEFERDVKKKKGNEILISTRDS